MGVLTHLDKFQNNKSLRRIKKTLKKRFWTEVCDGAKVFYLSGMINGKLSAPSPSLSLFLSPHLFILCLRYHKREVLNLSRFLAVMKFRPIIWRNTHPFVLVDRVEELTEPEDIRRDPKCDRRVCVYGYVRGTYMKKNTKVDFFLSCQLPPPSSFFHS